MSDPITVTYVFEPVDPHLESWVNATYGSATVETGVPVSYLKKLFPQVVKYGPHPEDVLAFIKTIAKAGEMFRASPRAAGRILLDFTKSWQVLATTMPDRKVLDNLVHSHPDLDFALTNFTEPGSIIHMQVDLNHKRTNVVVDDYYRILTFLNDQEVSALNQPDESLFPDNQVVSLQTRFEAGLFFTRAAIYSKHLIGEEFESEPGVMKVFDAEYRDALLAPYREMDRALNELTS